MSFRLSTLVLAIALLCVALAWYAKSPMPIQRNVIGVWTETDIGYPSMRTRLAFRADGTFSRTVLDWHGPDESLFGTYRWQRGHLLLHLKSIDFKATPRNLIELGVDPKRLNQDVVVQCRVAIDSVGNLVVRYISVRYTDVTPTGTDYWNKGFEGRAEWQTFSRN